MDSFYIITSFCLIAGMIDVLALNHIRRYNIRIPRWSILWIFMAIPIAAIPIAAILIAIGQILPFVLFSHIGLWIMCYTILPAIVIRGYGMDRV